MSAEILELGTRPIRPDAPGGDSGRDEPEFESLQGEIRKLELPDQPTVDWGKAVTSASELMTGKSKDLLAASYLAVALLERDGLPGLAIGLTVLRDLITNFWETMFPPVARARGRTAAIEWLAERGAPRVARARNVTPETVKTCLDRVNEINAALGPKLESGSQLMGDMRRALEELQAATRQPAPPAQAQSAAAPATAAAPSAAPATIATDEDLDKTLRELKRIATSAGNYMRQSAPTNPAGYRLPRVATWLAVKQVPPSDGGKTQIPAPQPADLQEKLSQMLGNGQFAGVLQETEGRMGTAVFWLDLHRMAAQALEGMGEEYKPAADAIAAEVGALLARFPDLLDMRFVNDQPLADADTKRWIARHAQSSSDASAAPVEVETSEEDGEGDTFESTRLDAWKLVRKRKVSDALSLLEKGMARSGLMRDRVRWRLEIARVCMDKGHAQTALAQLEGLDAELKSSTIEEWDPELCAEVLRNLLVCRKKVMTAAKMSPEEAVRSRELMGRLCRLDVVAALELNGK